VTRFRRDVQWLLALVLQWLLALVLSGCATPSNESTPVPPARVTRANDWSGMHETPIESHAGHPTSGAWVLHVGDSFVDAWFQQNLRSRFSAAGARYLAEGVTATYTTTWAYNPQLDHWLWAHPALVIVTIGANEVDVPVPEAHARAIERIAHKIAASGASCVFTSPPLWKNDTGILQVIHDHCAPCLFFDSDDALGGLTPAERQRDGIHPNSRGGARWAEAFWSWLVDHRDLGRGDWVLVPYERRG
jgi:lysophospholipase L1-like esterase